MKVLGLTGSIGMGKSTTARMFADLGWPVWDADAAVHSLYAPGGRAVAPVTQAFGPVADDQGGIDRKALSEVLKGHSECFSELEAIVHPLVAEHRAAFLEAATQTGAAWVVLDVPLLFETGLDATMDATVVVSADPAIQRERVLARPGMTEAAFETILSRQMADTEKRRRADYVIDTGMGLESARQQVLALTERLSRLDGVAKAQQ
ncbi:MAG: dephospho-CoA kinase [Asticcacaulis sp.]